MKKYRQRKYYIRNVGKYHIHWFTKSWNWIDPCHRYEVSEENKIWYPLWLCRCGEGKTESLYTRITKRILKLKP